MKKTTKEIYLDHAATTYIDPKVKKAMDPYLCEEYGNPSGLYSIGKRAKTAIDEARDIVANYLHARNSEIIFCGSGTESDNMAIFGIARANEEKGRHIITSKIEHHAVFHACEYLEKRKGYEVSYLNVDKYGLVDPEELKKSIRPDTVLVSIMYANNEIGTIEPIEELGKICKSSGVYFHTDACQAAGVLDLDVDKLHINLMTINGSKIYGPKGVGVLYIRDGTKIEPIIFGGGQEMNMRAGTENVAGIVGLAKALEISQESRKKEVPRLIKLRDKLINGILKIPKTHLNGHPINRLPNNINISILDIEGEALLLYLDNIGICASTGSACTSKRLEPSHVLLAIGLPHEAAHGSLRLTLGKRNTEKDVDYVLDVLPKIVERLREMSPVDLDAKIMSP